jgi:uncharacterized protein
VVPEPVAFVADAMLGSLARKLRVLGFDTVYYREGSDSDLEGLARRQNRILLTSDERLFQHATAKGLRAFLVKGSNERARVRSMVGEADSASVVLVRGTTRCAECNGVLKAVRRAGLEGRIPEKVLRRHRDFYECTTCLKIYWKGRHWSRLRRLSALVGP